MTDNPREMVAERFDRAAAELRTAADHLDIAAGHFRAGEVPRGCAHGFAAEGHMVNARRLVDENAVVHSEHASTGQ